MNRPIEFRTDDRVVEMSGIESVAVSVDVDGTRRVDFVRRIRKTPGNAGFAEATPLPLTESDLALLRSLEQWGRAAVQESAESG